MIDHSPLFLFRNAYFCLIYTLTSRLIWVFYFAYFTFLFLILDGCAYTTAPGDFAFLPTAICIQICLHHQNRLGLKEDHISVKNIL